MGVSFPGLLLVLFSFVLWLWALIEIIRSDFKDSSQKIIWLLVLIFILKAFSLIHESLKPKCYDAFPQQSRH
ncbi:PLDc N-terminal domain-containing protein [Chryseolinea lacunae]